jgi:hypothetical protein
LFVTRLADRLLRRYQPFLEDLAVQVYLDLYVAAYWLHLELGRKAVLDTRLDRDWFESVYTSSRLIDDVIRPASGCRLPGDFEWIERFPARGGRRLDVLARWTVLHW